jgi:pSer/pThr/pTyr-binding forkhead associated (FHA) protein
MSPQSFQLVMRAGPSPGKANSLSKSEIRIGRDPKNDISIDDKEISRHHARLVLQGETYVIEDVGSTNGTFVNGERITGPVSLQAGSTIGLGERIALSYELETADEDATVVASSQAMPAPGPAPAPPMPAPPAPVPGTPTPPAPARPPAYASRVPKSAPAGAQVKSNRKLLIGCGIVLVVAICVTAAALWYIDANYLWCDVFGGLIPACG